MNQEFGKEICEAYKSSQGGGAPACCQHGDLHHLQHMNDSITSNKPSILSFRSMVKLTSESYRASDPSGSFLEPRLYLLYNPLRTYLCGAPRLHSLQSPSEEVSGWTDQHEQNRGCRSSAQRPSVAVWQLREAGFPTPRCPSCCSASHPPPTPSSTPERSTAVIKNKRDQSLKDFCREARFPSHLTGHQKAC